MTRAAALQRSAQGCGERGRARGAPRLPARCLLLLLLLLLLSRHWGLLYTVLLLLAGHSALRIRGRIRHCSASGDTHAPASRWEHRPAVPSRAWHLLSVTVVAGTGACRQPAPAHPHPPCGAAPSGDPAGAQAPGQRVSMAA